MTTTPTDPTPAIGPADAPPSPRTFTTAGAIPCAEAGLYCQGRAATPDGQSGTWRLPVVAFDQYGRPLLANVGSVGGTLLPAAALDPAYVLLSRAQVVPGSDAPIEYTDAAGIRRLGTVPAWGIDLAGTVEPLHVTDRPATARRVERDADGQIIGTVEE